MKLTELLDCFKKWMPYDGVWFGAAKMDNTKEKAICLYRRSKATANNIAIGGAAATGYQREPMTLLVRWTANAVRAEEKAGAVYDAVADRTFSINGRQGFLQAVYAAAAPLGTDHKGIYEYAIDFDFYYEK